MSAVTRVSAKDLFTSVSMRASVGNLALRPLLTGVRQFTLRRRAAGQMLEQRYEVVERGDTGDDRKVRFRLVRRRCQTLM